MIVKEVMRTNVISVTPETTVTEAKELMNKNNISKLPVLNKGELVGIVTKNDLLQAGPSQATTLDMYEISYLLSKLTVKKVMSTKVISVPPEQVVEEAARIMVDNQIGCLPVVSKDVVVGIITESDLFHLFTEMFGAKQKGVRAVFAMNDMPGELTKIAQKISSVNGNIVSLVTSDFEDDGDNNLNDSSDGKNKKRRVTIKVSDVSIEQVKEILNSINITPEDIRML